MPAFTIAAACRYALTGVGAAMAPGSQKWKGKIADLLSAPTSRRTSAASTTGPVGATARYLRNARRADVHDHQDDADQHDESAERGHQECLQRGATAGGAAVVEPDQQVRQHARQFPEHDEHNEVVRDDESVHRAGECEEHRRELPHAVGLAAEVPAAVEHDQAPTPVTMSAMTHDSVSRRADSAMPSCGIHWNDSKGMSPARTSGVSAAV